MARILVIEDEAILGLLLSEVLAGMGHIVCGVVPTEDAAVAAAALHQPDLLIVDAGLLVGTGISAVDKILAARFVPHVFTSGNALAVRLLKPDAIILEKPFHESELAEAIALALCQTGDVPA
ncbi:response regulator [Aquisediminimonas profunda]|uniref:response regulator n=1 Tax=Aquisediminimonas profunda TaxID=1550733 RepID=UPI001C62765E|nr:response regulator [Aquisediminimonas profunda]